MGIRVGILAGPIIAIMFARLKTISCQGPVVLDDISSISWNVCAISLLPSSSYINLINQATLFEKIQYHEVGKYLPDPFLLGIS